MALFTHETERTHPYICKNLPIYMGRYHWIPWPILTFFLIEDEISILVHFKFLRVYPRVIAIADRDQEPISLRTMCTITSWIWSKVWLLLVLGTPLFFVIKDYLWWALYRWSIFFLRDILCERIWPIPYIYCCFALNPWHATNWEPKRCNIQCYIIVRFSDIHSTRYCTVSTLMSL